jgi:hypothetical protein
MIWNSELEELALEVADLYGERALTDAMIRALRTAHEQSRQPSARLQLLRPGTLESALRSELRKLLVLH